MADSRGGGAREELAVAALLLNFRGAAMTLQCVRDLLAVEDVILTIVVIDNASGSEDVRMLQDGVAALQCGAHTVHVLPQSVNLGFSGGMNKGIEFAAQHDERRVAHVALPRDHDLARHVEHRARRRRRGEERRQLGGRDVGEDLEEEGHI